MKKKIVSICLVMALLAVGAVGMYAYFIDEDSVTNTFTTGDVEISLDEAVVDEYGNTLDESGDITPDSDLIARTDVGNNDEDGSYLLIPGHVYTKDPTVTVTAGSEPCYVRMKVEVKNLEQLVKAMPAADYSEYYATKDSKTVFLLQKLVGNWDKSKWDTDWDYGFDGTNTYEFRYTSIVDAREEAKKLEALFETITIPSSLDNEAVDELEALEINVTAQAIQADGFATSDGYSVDPEEWDYDADEAALAWAAFDAQPAR